MKLNIDVGHPEALLLCGTYLMINNYFGFGLALLIFGFLGGIFRTGLRIQEAQQKLEEKEKIFKEMSNAGEELGNAFVTLLSTLGSKEKSNKNQGGSFH